MDDGPTEACEVLVFSRTTSYRHASIAAGIAALQRLAEQSPVPFRVTASEDTALFDSAAGLARFRVVVFLHASGDFLDSTAQVDALKAYVRSGGGGVVGIHGATVGMPTRHVDTEGWYGRLLGAEFADHPEPQSAVVRVVDAAHTILARGSAMKGMAQTGGGRCDYTWDWFDEWYNFQDHPREKGNDNNIHVLLAVDEASYHGGKHGPDHPVAWCHEFEGARSFYTALGHFDDAYRDETFMAQILNAILWTARLID